MGAPDHAMNRRGYDSIAAQWDDVRTALSDAERRYLDHLLQGLVPGAKVLDLGCGTGRPIAEHILDAGFAVTGVDQSSGMLDVARSRLPSGTWIESSLEHYQPDPGYAAAVAWDALFHVTRADHAEIFRRVRTALDQEGRFMLTVGGSAQAPFTDEMFGERFFYDSNTPDETMAILRELGFRIEIGEFLNRPTSGRDKGRFGILASVG